MRARDVGIEIGHGNPGPHNGITDVPGVKVGHTTLIEGSGRLVVGQGPVRTGVTAIVPHEQIGVEPLFAGCHRLNGNGELTGLEWIRESGMLFSPIALTNTHSVGVVRDALVAADVKRRVDGGVYWSLPVVGETWDGVLNDVNGMHVRAEHLHQALAAASEEPIAEGNVGGGTGMICHGFKGGIGTSSRVLPEGAGSFTVGVLVQANYGLRERLTVNGVPVGEEIGPDESALPEPPSGPPADDGDVGSIIAIVGTDAPLLPHQCERVAQRVTMGLARMGSVGGHTSGDLFLAFSTGNTGLLSEAETIPVRMFPDHLMTELFIAVVDATEEAILNALLAAETMTGRDGITAHRLDPDRLVEVMRAYNRLPRS
jgi:D-aminopeptidase